MKLKDMIFGGYASDPWGKTSTTTFGKMSCFLFNIQKDARINPKLKQEHGGKTIWQWQNNHSFSFGTYDLVIDVRLLLTSHTHLTSSSKTSSYVQAASRTTIPSISIPRT